jgi:DNA-binding transcriptional regulator YhcF (GntR family)
MTLPRFRLQPGRSIFDQVVFAAIKAFVSGDYAPGQAFPSVRALAADLKINPNTAHKVIQHLIQERWLEVHPGIGTVVAEPPRARPGETVLLVEDDADVRRWAASALETLGYRVVQAADAAAALELLDSPAARRVDLLFTDVVLAGGMTGRELAEALAARRPNVPALFTSGYPREPSAAAEAVDLEKPYELERLAAVVRSAIDSASSTAAPSDTGLPKK